MQNRHVPHCRSLAANACVSVAALLFFIVSASFFAHACLACAHARWRLPAPPRSFDKPISQLGTYVTRLVSQNKVSFANGLYTRGSATTTQKAQRSSEAAGSEAEAKPKARRSRGSCKARSPKAASPSDPQVSSEAVQASVLLSAAAETSSASAPAPELPEPAAAAPKAKRGSAKSSRSKAASPDAGEQTPEPTSEAAPMAAAKREGRKRSPRRTSPSKSPKPGDVVVPAAEAAAAGESSVVEAAAAGAAAAAAVRGVAAVTAEESAGCVPQVVAEDVGQAAPAVSPAAAERDMAEHEPHVLAVGVTNSRHFLCGFVNGDHTYIDPGLISITVRS